VSARARFAAALAAVLLAGCGGGDRLQKLAPDAVVLAFGDSLTHGTGAGAEASYPATLERAIGRKVVNAGVPGETSAAGLERLPRLLEETRPALVILCHGGNDFLRRMDDAAAARNLREMIQLARAQGAEVVLLATPKPTLPPSVPSFYGEIARELKVPFEEGVMKSVLMRNDLKSDMVHPNERGYAEIAGAVHALLRRSGAL
jgi:lysophospholipase L1-like esterase